MIWIIKEARKWLKAKGACSNDCILVKDGVYYWNGPVTVVEDEAEMERLAKEAKD